MSPHDTAASSSTRFGVELVAWVAGPWATLERTGSWLATVAVVVFLVGLPALFNTPGDKNINGVATSGPVRVLIEMFLVVVAGAGVWFVWPRWAFVLVVALSIVLVVSGFRRYRWLLAGAPPVTNVSQ